MINIFYCVNIKKYEDVAITYSFYPGPQRFKNISIKISKCVQGFNTEDKENIGFIKLIGFKLVKKSVKMSF